MYVPLQSTLHVFTVPIVLYTKIRMLEKHLQNVCAQSISEHTAHVKCKDSVSTSQLIDTCTCIHVINYIIICMENLIMYFLRILFQLSAF